MYDFTVIDRHDRRRTLHIVADSFGAALSAAQAIVRSSRKLESVVL